MALESVLSAESIAGTKYWKLTKVLSFISDDTRPCARIDVPIGYKTDWSSIPWGLRNISHPSEFPEAAAVHDYIYTDLCHRFTKKAADMIFKELLLELGCGRIKAQIMYMGVRVGGRGNWNKPLKQYQDDWDSWL